MESKNNFEEFKKNMEKVPKPLKIILIFLIVIILIGLIGGASSDYESDSQDKAEQTENSNKQEKQEEKKPEKEYACNDEGKYEYEYNDVLRKLYPYGFKISRIMDYTIVRETDTECLYRTTITITNEYGAKSSHTMFIGTNLDKANRKETLKNIMIDNIYVYEK